ncbi:Cd(II)/Pb(II)-responsive transcriptional regulator [Andreprevotia lacus DSM 23236]|jgi:Cd(II)/Pb(II)-responsive transcriptional regulator|uniref:Cd(II)/Pb(II)-responsive transcriptional regulator n=1 Tax=Andreprevotia lacus DSM 23236 TaxID=1121001 RepID=A0A1W1XZQ2_9NEIS|nr:Cd(II)/Pb(II)-responsive transcriptional regulator [Andreprevotia lacus]SMC29396.1 Cd(II)/Pb(II)-responsive transcriptional regulator [Andreprevotia lacus DSM 23236]
MKIGELAQAAQCSVETVRYYEKEGLLPEVGRTGGNYRNYGPEHVERLRFIRNCRALDMTHGEIRALLELAQAPNEGCESINQLIDEHIGHVDARIQELLHLKIQLAELRLRCSGGAAGDACRILDGISEMSTEPAHRHTHLG